MIVQKWLLACFASCVCFLPYANENHYLKSSSDFKGFKENKGQVSDQNFSPRNDILYYGELNGLSVYFMNNGFSYQLYEREEKQLDTETINNTHLNVATSEAKLKINRIDFQWIGCNNNVVVSGILPFNSYDNYYLTTCPAGALGVKSFRKIEFNELYKGIKLLWYEKDGEMKYDYFVKPGFDYKDIKVKVTGANKIFIDMAGNLIVENSLGKIIEKKPSVFQNNKQLDAKWIVNKGIISFEINGVDNNAELIIDPMIRLWGTYYGGLDEDYAGNLHVDSNDNIFMTGGTKSINNIATTGSHQVSFGGVGSTYGDAFLVKFSSNGNRLWSTYYGGSSNDYAGKCITDSNGNVIMTGATSSTNTGVIATPGAFQVNSSIGASGFYLNDAFLVKFDSTGARIWGTYYGGNSFEIGIGCDVDSNDNIYLVGSTASSINISSPGAYQPNLSGTQDGFIVKFNPFGLRLWSSYYGGTNAELIYDCKCDKLGNVYFTGSTTSSVGISTSGSHQVAYSGLGDAFLVKFDGQGTRLWGTYYGGDQNDDPGNICIDNNGDIILGGNTRTSTSGVMATSGTHQFVNGGFYDVFIAKFSPLGVRMWGTYYGGNADDRSGYVCSDATGNIYVSGFTSQTFSTSIATFCSYQDKYGGGQNDAFLAKFNTKGIRQWGTYYGGNAREYGRECQANTKGEVYLCGVAFLNPNSFFGTIGAHQETYGGGANDAFLVKFDGCRTPTINTPPDSQVICNGDSSFITTTQICGINWYENMSGNPIATGSIITISPSVNTVYYLKDESCGIDNIPTAITVTVNQLPKISISSSTQLLCYNSSISIESTGATSYTWSPNNFISCVNCSSPILTPLQTTEYCVKGEDDNGCIGDTCIVIQVDLTSDKKFTLPNAFTPNSDGNNDEFCLQGWGQCNKSFKIMVFSRWGEKVFESDDPNFCWDGLYNGRLLSADVYAFTIYADYNDGTVINKKGNITLIR